MNEAEMQAKLSAFETELNSFKAKLEEKDNQLETLSTEKAELETKFNEVNSEKETKEKELETTQAKLEEIEKANAEAEVEAFLSENEKRFPSKNRDFWKETLMNAKENGSDAYEKSKAALLNQDELDIYSTQANEDKKAKDEKDSKTLNINLADINIEDPEQHELVDLAITKMQSEDPKLSVDDAIEKIRSAGGTK